MPRILPSQIVDAIDRLYPWARRAADGQEAYAGALEVDQAPNVSMLIELLNALPPELYPPDPEAVVTIHAAKGAMSGAISSWSGAPHPGRAARLGPSAVFGGLHPIAAVLKVLRTAPDEAPSAAAPDLAFVTDPDHRAALRLDVSTAERAFSNGEFKAATVLAGSVVEALLLSAIQAKPAPDVAKAVADENAARAGAKRKSLAAAGPEHWGLADYIAVGTRLGILDEALQAATDLAREYRNLIHPGLATRTAARCTRGTALQAMAAMNLVIERLSKAP